PTALYTLSLHDALPISSRPDFIVAETALHCQSSGRSYKPLVWMRLLNAPHSTMIRGGKSARQFVCIGGNMKTKTCAITVTFLLASASVCFSSIDADLVNLEMNEAKSKMAAGVPKNHTVVYEAAGDSIKVTIDGTDSDGKPTHN